MNDEWHIRIDRQYLDPVAGSSARAKELELVAGRGKVRRFVERLTDARTDDRSWRRGAEGEERVAAILARSMPAHWTVVHDLPIGSKGANLDHLLIGPAGIFALNTKNLTGRLTVYDHAILQNGRKTAFVPNALREARTVQDRLSAATSRPVSAWSVIVLVGRCTVEVKARPSNLTIMSAAQLPRWLAGLPGGKLNPGDVLRFERAARDPETWQPRRPDVSREAQMRGSRSPAAPPGVQPADASVPPHPATGPPPIGDADDADAVNIKRWKRYGKDRFYANSANGAKLGFIDVLSGEFVLECADETGSITARLRAARADAVSTPPTTST